MTANFAKSGWKLLHRPLPSQPRHHCAEKANPARTTTVEQGEEIASAAAMALERIMKVREPS